MIPSLVLLLLVIVPSVKFDVTERRIPNKFIATSLVLSMVFSVLGWTVPHVRGVDGFIQWGGGLLIGFACLIPLYLLRAMGAGDVKLMSACGACLGTHLAWQASLMSLVLAGVLALAWMVWQNLPIGVLIPQLGAVFAKAESKSSKLVRASRDAAASSPLEKTAVKLPFSVAVGAACIGLIYFSR